MCVCVCVCVCQCVCVCVCVWANLDCVLKLCREVAALVVTAPVTPCGHSHSRICQHLMQCIRQWDLYTADNLLAWLTLVLFSDSEGLNLTASPY